MVCYVMLRPLMILGLPRQGCVHGRMTKEHKERGPTRRWLGREEGRRAATSAAVLPPLTSGTTAKYQERYYHYKYRHYYRTTPNALWIVNSTSRVSATYYRCRNARNIRERAAGTTAGCSGTTATLPGPVLPPASSGTTAACVQSTG